MNLSQFKKETEEKFDKRWNKETTAFWEAEIKSFISSRQDLLLEEVIKMAEKVKLLESNGEGLADTALSYNQALEDLISILKSAKE